MRMVNFNKIFFHAALLLVLVLCGKAYCETTEELAIKELVGRNNPFTIVTPQKAVVSVKNITTSIHMGQL